MSEIPPENVETEDAATQPTSRKPPEASTSVDGRSSEPATTNPEEQEQNTIVQTMDAETTLIRKRKSAYYSRHQTLISKWDLYVKKLGVIQKNLDRSGERESSESSEEEGSQYEGVPEAEGEFVLTEDNYNCLIKSENNNLASGDSGVPSTSNEDNETPCIKVKLKYINDDLKLVECRLQETVGQFKR